MNKVCFLTLLIAFFYMNNKAAESHDVPKLQQHEDFIYPQRYLLCLQGATIFSGFCYGIGQFISALYKGFQRASLNTIGSYGNRNANNLKRGKLNKAAMALFKNMNKQEFELLCASLFANKSEQEIKQIKEHLVRHHNLYQFSGFLACIKSWPEYQNRNKKSRSPFKTAEKKSKQI